MRRRLTRFFRVAARAIASSRARLAPIVFSWLAGRGAERDAARSARRRDRRGDCAARLRRAAGGRGAVYRANRCDILQIRSTRRTRP